METLFTPSALLDFLTSIDELKEKPISIEEQDSVIAVTIGDNTYNIDKSASTEIAVEEDTVEEIATANEEGYIEVEESNDVEISDPVEGGVIKGLIKTLMLGGLVSMTARAIKNI